MTRENASNSPIGTVHLRIICRVSTLLHSCAGTDTSERTSCPSPYAYMFNVDPGARGRVPRRGLNPQIRMETNSLQLHRMFFKKVCEWLFYHNYHWLPCVPIIEYARTMLVTVMDPGLGQSSDPAISAPAAF